MAIVFLAFFLIALYSLWVGINNPPLPTDDADDFIIM